MKKGRLTTIFFVAAVVALFTSCSESVTEELNMDEKSAEFRLTQGDLCTYDGVLNEKEIEGLIEMREEEKLARDVYLKLYEIHDLVIFQNIANSENAHTGAIKRLLEGYEIEDPIGDEQGIFTNPAFSTLFTELTEKGSLSETEALKTGAFIEDLDIADLKKLLAETENSDVKRVYTNLLKGSENHMRAFVSALGNLGESYTPEFISMEELEEILTSENSKGNGNQQGNGNKGNNTNENCDGTQTGSASGSGNQYGKTGGNQKSNGNGNGGAQGNSNGNGRG